MKDFFIKLTVFTFIFISLYVLALKTLSNGYVDVYYKKFTQEAGGLIIGVSKASKGINPDIIENELKEFNFETPIVNFALNVSNSKYGDVYFEAIKKKLKQQTSKKQLFIISVSPGSFTAPANLKAVDIIEMDKKNTIIGKVDWVKTTPNYNYIVETYDQPLYNAFHSYDKDPKFTMHKNGWVEIKLNDSLNDSIVNKDILFWKGVLLRHFKKEIDKQEISNYRINSFIEIVKFLKSRGRVFVLTIPEDKEFIETEKLFWANFETQMDSITSQLDVPFFNYWHLSNKLRTYDGLHLESDSAKKFTLMLSKDIKHSLVD